MLHRQQIHSVRNNIELENPKTIRNPSSDISLEGF
jgi:hypothetical protein